DVFGMYNNLDHFLEPIDIIRQALNISRLVFIDVHASGEQHTFSRQHLYSFGKTFFDTVLQKDCSCIDITDVVMKNNQNCYLLSKEIDLIDLRNSEALKHFALH